MHTTGVLGSLTADQEARLQQLWMFLLNSFDSQEFFDNNNFSMSSIWPRSQSIDEPPLSPSSINTTISSGHRRVSLSSSKNTNVSNVSNFSNPFMTTGPNTPMTPGFPPTLPTSPTMNSELNVRRSQHQLSLKKLRRRTSLLSNGWKISNEKFSTEPSTPNALRRASTRRGSLTFQTQSLGGVNLRPSPQNTKVIQQVLASYKLTPDELRLGLLASLKHDHPDAMLLRFLRARKWDVGKAFVMLVAAVAWRTKKMHVDDDILPRGEIYALQQMRSFDRKESRKGWDFMKQFHMGKNIIHGVDRAGRPIIDIRVRLHRAEDQSVEVLERYIVHTIESVRMLLRPPFVETAILIFDMTDFSMTNMDYTPVKYFIKCIENLYPECLAAIILHKAPWFFSGIWKMIKTWMSDSLVSKVHFTKTLDDLERFIPRSNIPSDLGGTDDTYQYHYIEPDMNDRAENLSLDVHSPTREFLASQRERIAENFLEATRLWLQTIAMRDEIGLANQEARRAELIEELRLNFWKLDPFMRARCQLDREGIIVSDGIGTIEFYPHLRAVERRGRDTMEGEAVTSPSPESLMESLPESRINRNSQAGVGSGLLSPSSSTLGADENVEKVGQDMETENMTPKTPHPPLNFLDDATSISTDNHDHDDDDDDDDDDHDESSTTRDEIMQEYMDDNYDDDYNDNDYDHHPSHQSLPYKQEPEYYPPPPQQPPPPLPVNNHFSASHKESEISYDLDDLDEEDEDEDIDDDDDDDEEEEEEEEEEEIEIHDAVTHRIAYPRGGGIVHRAAVRVINVR
ncbi:phosphatidylinositol transfer protein csr1 [Talaromyces marneffei ATCC 18224]|uniref:CRAL-TRIO domain-containing protein n=1 Tax=Talaromyces marneffei (strain ATCC 18224 / CBS 334.59 / QM 7333) TaxID=441960 RepID=B6QTL1_TALMQ|nr:conserved hypothetical protein [Talaromyces marneffei ATCC 18224]